APARPLDEWRVTPGAARRNRVAPAAPNENRFADSDARQPRRGAEGVRIGMRGEKCASPHNFRRTPDPSGRGRIGKGSEPDVPVRISGNMQPVVAGAGFHADTLA